MDGRPRADIVLGDRDGTTCAPEFTAFVRDVLAGHGYDVKVNDPFKGVELVRAYADPAGGRHSLQLEINKRLYMDTATLQQARRLRRAAGSPDGSGRPDPGAFRGRTHVSPDLTSAAGRPA